MTVLQIIVPVTHDKIHLLEECLRSIQECTPVDHLVHVVVGNAHIEDKVGEIIATSRKVYETTRLTMSVADPKLGYNGIVMSILKDSDFAYTAVLPASHRIADKSWFGKMQLPLIRAPGCGMTFAPDDAVANTTASFPASWKEEIPSMFFMVLRAVIGMVASTPIDDDGTDLATSVRDHLRTAATNCWAVPSCRIEQMHAEWR